MGKASRKLMKKQQQIKTGEVNQTIIEDKQKIALYKESGDYEEALLLVIELLEKKCYDVDVIFDAAELYFMAGDYERTSTWINKTLEFDPNHIGARILLAHTCMLSERLDDALKILEFILRTAKERLSQEQFDKIEELLEYFKYTSDLHTLKQDYPHIADFLEIEDDKVNEEMEIPVNQERDSNVEIAVREKSEVSNSLKETFDIEAIKNDIMEKQVSLQTKIALYNSFAGSCFFEDNIKDAEILLNEALMIDPCHAETLKNMVEIALYQKDKERALRYASELPIADFVLLKKIKEA